LLEAAASATRQHIGIIGGLGPLASADFYRRFVVACNGSSDQDHPEVTLVSSPKIPNRLRYLSDPTKHPDPVPELARVATRLVSDGCDILAMPSITTHALYDEVQRLVDVPIVNMIDSVVAGVRGLRCTQVAVLMTTPARRRGLLERAFTASGVQVYLPEEDLQCRTQAVVDSVKAGTGLAEAEVELARIVRAFQEYVPHDARVLIGCTDISPAAARLDVLDVSQLYAESLVGELKSAG
jgi:aspartate racemase